MEYKYNNVQINDLSVVATKINRLLGIMPKGLSDSGDTTTVYFSTPLTDTQKATLDTFMQGTNLDALPTTTRTAYLLADIETILGQFDIDVFPTKNGTVIQFQRTLNTQEKNAFRTAITSLLTAL